MQVAQLRMHCFPFFPGEFSGEYDFFFFWRCLQTAGAGRPAIDQTPNKDSPTFLSYFSGKKTLLCHVPKWTSANPSPSARPQTGVLGKCVDVNRFDEARSYNQVQKTIVSRSMHDLGERLQPLAKEMLIPPYTKSGKYFHTESKYQHVWKYSSARKCGKQKHFAEGGIAERVRVCGGEWEVLGE